MGPLSFTHSHNHRSELQEKRKKQTSPVSVNNSSPTIEQGIVTHSLHHDNKETDLKLAHDIKQLSVNEDTIVDTSGVEELNVMASDTPDDIRNNNTSSNGVTFDIPVTSSTTIQPIGHFPIPTAAGNHTQCTSVFIDTVEWLSPLIIGQLDGKVRHY